MSKELVKTLLGLAIQALGKFIPALGGFLGGPLGFIATLAISWLSGILFDLIERYQRYNAIDDKYLEIGRDAMARTQELLAAYESAGSTPEQKEKALEDFKSAHRRIKLGGVQHKNS